MVKQFVPKAPRSLRQSQNLNPSHFLAGEAMLSHPIPCVGNTVSQRGTWEASWPLDASRKRTPDCPPRDHSELELLITHCPIR